MKFTIDKRFITVQILKSIVCYLIGLFIVLYFLKPIDQVGFIISSMSACSIISFILIFPRKICVGNGLISFYSVNCYDKTEVCISDIIKVSIKVSLYNTLIFQTKSGNTYKLHPQKILHLKKLLSWHYINAYYRQSEFGISNAPIATMSMCIMYRVARQWPPDYHSRKSVKNFPEIIRGGQS